MRVKGAKKRVAIALAAALVVSGIGYVPKADAESVTQVTGDYSQEVNEACDTMEFVVSNPAFGSNRGNVVFINNSGLTLTVGATAMTFTYIPRSLYRF